MMSNYQTQSNDMIDGICANHYPDIELDQSITAVLSANPGLAAYGAQLPEGLIIQLPDITAAEIRATIKLWE